LPPLTATVPPPLLNKEEPMTLVVATPTQDGIVLAADKRSCDPLRGVRDTLTKVVAVGPRTAVALTGRPIVESCRDGPAGPAFATLYDAEAEIRDFYLAVEPLFPETTTDLTDKLCSGFESYLATQPFADWPETGESPEHTLYLAVFAHWGESERGCQLVMGRFLYEKVRDRPLRGMRWTEVSADKLAFARAIPFGNLAVIREIRHGDDPRFDDLRSHSGVRRFLLESTPADTVSAREAADFSKFLVEECSNRTPLLDGSPYLIGPTCDVVVVSESRGVSWLG
jgi:hypothetical protein